MPTTTARAHRDTLASIPEKAAAIVRRWRRARLAFEGRGDMFGRRRMEELDKGRRAFLKEVYAIEDEAREAAEGLFAELRRVRARVPRLGVEDQLAWERLRAHLDGAERGREVDALEARMRRAAEEGDDAMLRVGRIMAPDHLAGRGVTLQPEIRDILDELSGDDAIREAVALERHARKKGTTWVAMAINFVANEIQGNDVNPNIPTWTGDVIELGEVPDYQAVRREAEFTAGAQLRAAGYLPDGEGGVQATNPT